MEVSGRADAVRPAAADFPRDVCVTTQYSYNTYVQEECVCV